MRTRFRLLNKNQTKYVAGKIENDRKIKKKKNLISVNIDNFVQSIGFNTQSKVLLHLSENDIWLINLFTTYNI